MGSVRTTPFLALAVVSVSSPARSEPATHPPAAPQGTSGSFGGLKRDEADPPRRKRGRDPEEAVAEGEEPVDAERRPALPRIWEPTRRFPVHVGLLVWRSTGEASQGYGFGATLTVPFDQLAAQPARPLTPVGPSIVPASYSDPATRREAIEEARLPSGEVRRVVRAAWRAARLLPEEERLQDLASRARTSATLPELRLRVVRSVDDSLRLSPTSDDPDRTIAASGVGMRYEARATWRLDRLAFADDEVALERLRIERSEQRMRLTFHVLEALSAWQRARLRASDDSLPAFERSDASIREIIAATTLDALTDGAWSDHARR